jgi:hypothetical protein
MLRWVTQIHKWLALIVGIQVVGWVLGGVIMTALPIDMVRGKHLYEPPAPQALPAEGLLDYRAASQAVGVTPVEASLKGTLRGVVWVLKDADGKTHVVAADTGARVGPMDAREARMLASATYAGTGQPVATRFYAEAPAESSREGPLWRVDFDDAVRTAFYLTPETGEVVSRRTHVWRFYDFFFRIHVMNFGKEASFNHPLVIIAAVVTLVMTIAGVVLLWIRLRRDWIGARKARAKARAA